MTELEYTEWLEDRLECCKRVISNNCSYDDMPAGVDKWEGPRKKVRQKKLKELVDLRNRLELLEKELDRD